MFMKRFKWDCRLLGKKWHLCGLGCQCLPLHMLIVVSSLPIYVATHWDRQAMGACFEKDWEAQRRAEQAFMLVSQCHSKDNIVLLWLSETFPVGFKSTLKERGLFVLLCENAESGNAHCSFWFLLFKWQRIILSISFCLRVKFYSALKTRW